MSEQTRDDALAKVLQEYLGRDGEHKHIAEAVFLLSEVHGKQKKAKIIAGILAEFCDCEESFALAALDFIRELSGSRNKKLRAFVGEVNAAKTKQTETAPDPHTTGEL